MVQRSSLVLFFVSVFSIFCTEVQGHIYYTNRTLGPMRGISLFWVIQQHQDLCVLLFAISVWVLLRSTEVQGIEVLWDRTDGL